MKSTLISVANALSGEHEDERGLQAEADADAAVVVAACAKVAADNETSIVCQSIIVQIGLKTFK